MHTGIGTCWECTASNWQNVTQHTLHTCTRLGADGCARPSGLQRGGGRGHGAHRGRHAGGAGGGGGLREANSVGEGSETSFNRTSGQQDASASGVAALCKRKMTS